MLHFGQKNSTIGIIILENAGKSEKFKMEYDTKKCNKGYIR